MATTKLTERQQEVKKLLAEGKTPKEVGEILGITENAVYQQRTRIRKATGGRKTARRTTGRKSGTKRSTSRRSPSSSRRTSATPRAGLLQPTTPQPNSANTTTEKPMTPLQAIRHRKSEIETELKTVTADVATAEKAYEQAKVAAERSQSSHREELAKLEAAEAALSNAKPKPKRNTGKNGSGSKRAGQAAAKSAQAAPTPQATPAPEPEPAPASTSEEERPGVPVDPDFEGAEAALERDEAEAAQREADEAALVGAEGGDFAQQDGFGEE